MEDLNTPDPKAEEVLCGLQALFTPYAPVTPVPLNHPGIVAEFCPGSGKDTDLANLPKPALVWAFGVELGGIHDDARMCALVFTQFSRLQAFYHANPRLSGTLVSGWHSGAVIWLRATGQVPNNFAVDEVRWCSEGIVLIGCPTQQADTFISQAGEIKQINFTDIVWNERQKEAVEKILITIEVGGPFKKGTRGRRVLNLGYWAAYFSRIMSIRYDPQTEMFGWGDPKARQPALLTYEDTIKEFTNFLQASAPHFGAEFPEGEIRPARVRQLVERIKALTQQSRPSDNQVLDAFLKDPAARPPGDGATSREFRELFIAFCNGLGYAPCSAPRFYKMLKRKLKSIGIDPRHDLDRNGKQVRGYSGLSQKLAAPVKVPDATDGTDATDGE